MTNDWLYSPERMKLRANALLELHYFFGGCRIEEERFTTGDIYACAHDWVSQGNQTTAGIIKYFTDNYIRM